jgi:hypothetical protein
MLLHLDILYWVDWFKFKRGFKIIWKCFEIFEKKKEKGILFYYQLSAQISRQPTLARGPLASRARVARLPLLRVPPWAESLTPRVHYSGPPSSSPCRARFLSSFYRSNPPLISFLSLLGAPLGYLFRARASLRSHLEPYPAAIEIDSAISLLLRSRKLLSKLRVTFPKLPSLLFFFLTDSSCITMFTGICRRHSELSITLVLVRGEFAVIPSCFPSFLFVQLCSESPYWWTPASLGQFQPWRRRWVSVDGWQLSFFPLGLIRIVRSQVHEIRWYPFGWQFC